MNFSDQIIELARNAKAATRQMAQITTQEKNACISSMANALEKHTEKIIHANAKDLKIGRSLGISKSMMDRLRLNEERIKCMAEGLRNVVKLPDPVGRILEERTRPSGLHLKKISTPIGVIVIIYESRPNVTADAAGLCFKSSNVTILRGGKECLNSNKIIADILIAAGKDATEKFPQYAIQVIPIAERSVIPQLLSLTEFVDLCIPRGGEGLIRAVAKCSRVPVIKHYKGICSVYIDSDADSDKAITVVVNSKTQRSGVCNAMETLLIDKSIAPKLLPRIAKALSENGVELRADTRSQEILGQHIKAATSKDWDTEFLDLVCAVRVVDGIEGALDHISRHGSGHTESIITENESKARRFQNETDASTIFWNVSTRFSDGGEFGMGAEIGISTDKIGARGPMGLEELTTYKWLGEGNGLIRK